MSKPKFTSFRHMCAAHVAAMPDDKKIMLALIAKRKKFQLEDTIEGAKREKIKEIFVYTYLFSIGKHPYQAHVEKLALKAENIDANFLTL